MSKNNNTNVNDNEDEVFYDTVELDLGDGKTLECGVLSIFPLGQYDYIVLFPLEENEDGYLNLYYYRYEEDKDGNPIITNIEDDAEYASVADSFDAMINNMEFDEIVEDIDNDDSDN